MYNLAAGATNQGWLLENMNDLMTTSNATRGGFTLADIVDLVIIDYAVNDGFIDSGQLAGLGLPRSWSGAFTRLEAVSEYILHYS